MRGFVVFVIAVITLGFAASGAFAETSLTQSQVKNVCGKDLASGGGYSGCDKKCGKSICDYHCGPNGKCGAFVVGMSAPGGGGPKGTNWINRIHVQGAIGGKITDKSSPGLIKSSPGLIAPQGTLLANPSAPGTVKGGAIHSKTITTTAPLMRQ